MGSRKIRHPLDLDRHFRHGEAGCPVDRSLGRRQSNAGKDPARMGEDGHAHGVDGRLPLVAQGLQAIGDVRAAANHEVIDPILESRPGLARHPVRQLGGKRVSLEGESDQLVDKGIRIGPALPVEHDGGGRLRDHRHRRSPLVEFGSAVARHRSRTRRPRPFRSVPSRASSSSPSDSVAVRPSIA